MPISVNDVVIFSAGGVVGYLARTFIDHFLARSRVTEDRNIKAFNEAAIQFRSAFSEEITKLEAHTNGRSPDASMFIGEAFPTHRRAFNEFREYLSSESKPIFDKAWDDYDKGRKEGEYSDKFKNAHGLNPQEPHLVALERIGKLMKFASPK